MDSATLEDTCTALEGVVREEDHQRLLFHQDQLLAEIQEMITSFDDTLAHLHHEKSLMDVVCKTADLK